MRNVIVSTHIAHEYCCSPCCWPTTLRVLLLPCSPDGCMAGKCVQDSTTGGLRCVQCVNNLVADTATGYCGKQGGLRGPSPPVLGEGLGSSAP